MTNTNSALHKTLTQVIGAERTGRLFQVLTIPRGILNESGDTISRADGKTRLDLSFDSSNAQAIFKMTANAKELAAAGKA